MPESMGERIQRAVTKIPEEGAKKCAEIVARSFYREMKKYGLTNDQIIHVSSELLNCLHKSLGGYEEKLARQVKEKETDQELV